MLFTNLFETNWTTSMMNVSVARYQRCLGVIVVIWLSASLVLHTTYRHRQPELSNKLNTIRQTNGTCIANLSRDYMRAIVRDTARVANVSTNEESACEDKYSTRFEAWNENYFTNLSQQLPDIKTVFLEGIPACALYSEYYIPASNNCSLLKQYDTIHPERTRECNTGPVSVPSKVLPSKDLLVGLPQNHKNTDGHIWNLTYIHIIPRAIVDKQGDVIYRNARVVPQRCKPLVVAKPNCSNIDTHDEVFTISQYWGAGVFHGIAENIIRTAPYIAFLRQHPNIKIHVASMHRYMPLLGIDERRFVEGTLRAKILYMPAGTPCGDVTAYAIQQLALNFQFQQLNHNLPRDTIVLIRRSSKRFFKHHDDILRMLRRHASGFGLDVLEYRDDPVPGMPETIDMFHRAVAIIAPHGAGETNMIFSRPGTILMEGLCFDEFRRFTMCYMSMAHRLGLRYYGLAYEKGCGNITSEDIETPFLQLVEAVVNVG